MATGAVTSLVIARDAVGGEWLQLFGLWSIPIAVLLAMILAGLWDTDLARGRRAALVTTTALVGLALTGVIVSVAVGIAAPVAAALTAVTGTVVAFPVVWWVWRRAGQWLYGVGPDDAGRQLHEAEEEDLAGVVAAAVRAQGAAIVTDRGDCPADSLCLPLGRGQYLVVHPRRAGESFTRRDREAVDRMAEHLSRRLERRDLERELVEAHTALAKQRQHEQDHLRTMLHDEVGPLLVGAEMQAHAINQRAKGSELASAAAELDAALRQARLAMRSVLDEGSPRGLAHGLGPALTALCARWPHPSVQLRIKLPTAVDSHTAGAAYRVVAEGLANVAQHAEAESCEVSVTSSDRGLTVVISDDGVGIDPGRPYGIGLASMRGRALELGGDLSPLSAARVAPPSPRTFRSGGWRREGSAGGRPSGDAGGTRGSPGRAVMGRLGRVRDHH